MAEHPPGLTPEMTARERATLMLGRVRQSVHRAGLHLAEWAWVTLVLIASRLPAAPAGLAGNGRGDDSARWTP